MAQQEHEFVHLCGQSILAEEQIYHLDPNNLLINFTLDIAYLVPARLNVSELRDALARALATFPLFCGRLMRDPEWAISLSPSNPIPLIIKHEAKPSWDLSAANAVVRRQPGPHIDKVNPIALLSEDEPYLLKATISVVEDATLIGVSCSHIIADLHIVLKFLRTWSQHFTGTPTEPPPVYPKAINFEVPSVPSRLSYVRSKLPPLLFHTFPLDAIPPSIFSPFPIQRTDLRFTSTQVTALHASVLRLAQTANRGGAGDSATQPGSDPASSADHDGLGTRLTRQDALSAFIVAAINASYDEPVRQISNVINCRGYNPSVCPRDAIGNGLLYAVTDAISSDEFLDSTTSPERPVLAYALAIRRSLERARDPQYVRDVLAISGAVWLAAANSNLGHHIAETLGYIIINSSYRYAWSSVDFGYPGKVCWQHPDTVPTDSYVMMFPSNPVLDINGEWHVDEGACEATFNVKAGRGGALKEAVSQFWAEMVGGDGATPEVVTYL